MKTISFESPGWGHAMHTSTWRKEEPRSLTERVSDWWRTARRWSVMVHSGQRPEAGDLIRYKTNDGAATARIYAVEPCGNPGDMFTIKIIRDRPLDLEFNVAR